MPTKNHKFEDAWHYLDEVLQETTHIMNEYKKNMRYAKRRVTKRDIVDVLSNLEENLRDVKRKVGLL
jgi:hypothetical protein